ncbi:MAG: hypothetical protein JO000_24675, partial [Alphaproteobacteria bacterium]|nr:hypothetical protein [Alphaproteobacteria bacterium]
MRPFIKSFVVANLSFFAIALVVTCLAGVIAGVALGLSGAHEGSFSAMLETSSAAASAALLVIVVPAALGAGAIAARIATARPLAAGALAAAGWTLANVLIRVFGLELGTSPAPSWLLLALNYGAPLISAAGAFAASRASQFGAGDLARWAIALIAFATMEWIIIALTSASYVSGLLVFGVAIAIVIATAVAPARYRRAAGFTFMTLAVVTPLGPLTWQTAGPTIAPATWSLFAGIAGAAIGWTKLKIVFPRIFGQGGAWWWLATGDFARWSKAERRARNGMGWIVLVLGVG